MTLTKAGMIKTIRAEQHSSKYQSAEVLESLLEIIKKTLASGEDVMIRGFGRFCIKQKKVRRGRHPATGEALMLKPRKVVTFKPSGKLKAEINRSDIPMSCSWAQSRHC